MWEVDWCELIRILRSGLLRCLYVLCDYDFIVEVEGCNDRSGFKI